MNNMTTYFKTLLQRGKKYINAVKVGNIGVKSMTYFKLILAISLLPVITVVGLMAVMLVYHLTDEWYFKMIDYCLKIIDHVLTVQVMTVLVAYGKDIIDTNNDGIPDVVQSEISESAKGK